MTQTFLQEAKTVHITNSSLIVGSTCRDVTFYSNPVGLTENENYLLQIFNRLDLAHKIDFLCKAMQYEELLSSSGTGELSNICWTTLR